MIREYSSKKHDETLYVQVLLECQQCGHQDTLKENFEVEFIDPHADTKEEHSNCPICNNDQWSERAEYAKISLPNFSKVSHTQTMDDLILRLKETRLKLEIANENGFLVREVRNLNENGTIVIWK